MANTANNSFSCGCHSTEFANLIHLHFVTPCAAPPSYMRKGVVALKKSFALCVELANSTCSY